jgi:uncharacterized protein
MAIPAPQPGSAALVTGASSGIGRELARGLGARGHDVVLVARRRERLEELADELRRTHGRRAEVIACDVSEPDERQRLQEEIGALGLTIDVLALCAGFGMGGPFIDQDPERVQLMIRTNLESTVAVTRALVPGMAARRRGAVLIVSSMAGKQPMPNFGVYSATKAAVCSFAESLHEELRSSGVTVTALCPGGVATEFSSIAAMTRQERRMPRAFIATPEQTARVGLAALERGRITVVPGWAVRLLVFTGTHTPRPLWLRACSRLMA